MPYIWSIRVTNATTDRDMCVLTAGISARVATRIRVSVTTAITLIDVLRIRLRHRTGVDQHRSDEGEQAEENGSHAERHCWSRCAWETTGCEVENAEIFICVFSLDFCYVYSALLNIYLTRDYSNIYTEKFHSRVAKFNYIWCIPQWNATVSLPVSVNILLSISASQ